MEGKPIIGAVEEITVFSENSSKTLMGRIDTGARLSSIDTNLVAELGLGPIVRTKTVNLQKAKVLGLL